MLKKLSKMAMVLGLLTVAHLAYVRGFDLLTARLRAARAGVEIILQARDSESRKAVKQMAAEAFGSDHWTGTDDPYTYVVPNKGLVLFAMDIERINERDGVHFDGKRMEVSPAAMLLRSPKGGGTRSMISKKAVIDCNRPVGLSFKGDSEPLSIVRAVLEREVIVRDDRGTPDDPADDLVIGPINQVEYDGVNHVIRSESEILLVDRGLRVTGVGLEIQLSSRAEPGAKGPGIEGAQKITLFKNVRATFLDVGGAGVLPDVIGGGPAAKPKDAAKGEPIPLDVQCQGPLVVELPRKSSTPVVGPPEPPMPTGVEFQSNVVVRRGKMTELPDQIDCDTLRLTLLPAEAPAPAVVEGEAVAATDAEDGAAKGGAFGGLQLRRAQFSGHAVWVQSPAQGIKIRCVELLHYEDPAARKKTTVLNGGGPKKLWVEKREVAAVGQADAGQVRSVTHIWCNDATISDQDGRIALVANGPGLLESRPGTAADAPPRDVPPARTAVWQEQLWVQDEPAAEGREPGKMLVLKGSPRVEDRVGKSSLSADDLIIAYLNPPANKDGGRTTDGRDVVPTAFVVPDQTPGKTEVPDIRRLRALKNVHLVDSSHDYGFRDHLDVNFVTGAISAAPAKPAAQPNPAAQPSSSAPNEPSAPNDPKAPKEGAAPKAAEKPHEPKTTTMADRADAVIVVAARPASTADGAAAEGESSYEVRDVIMRGGVEIRQEPGAGKTFGTLARGQLLELHNTSKGSATFDLYHHDPYSEKDRGVDPAEAEPAVVQTDQMRVVAETIQVDQDLDLVRAFGRRGKLTMLVDRSTFTDRAPDAQAGEVREVVAGKKPNRRNGKEQSSKVPLSVTWNDRMTFEGVAQDPIKRPAAKIKFYGKARAEMEDALLYGEEYITLYTDRPIPLADAGKLAPGPKPAPAAVAVDDPPAEPKADLSMVEIKGTPRQRAVVLSRKVHPELRAVLNAQRMEAASIIYDRASGMFRAPGPGEVRLYDRGNGAESKNGFDATVAEGPGVRPVAYRADEDGPAGQVAASPDVGRLAVPRLKPLVLTQIRFQSEMRGRFGTGQEQDVVDQRWAEFFGAVETMRGEVRSERECFDPDRPPTDATALTSDMLRVINEPPPPGAEKTSSGRTFLKAWDDVNIRARDTALQADIVTYDSLNDLALAKGTDGRAVQILQQRGVGQPGSPGTADVVQLNPRTGALEVKGPGTWRLLDDRTEKRPNVVAPTPPGAEASSKPRQKPFRPPTNPVERRGFSGSGR